MFSAGEQVTVKFTPDEEAHVASWSMMLAEVYYMNMLTTLYYCFRIVYDVAFCISAYANALRRAWCEDVSAPPFEALRVSGGICQAILDERDTLRAVLRDWNVLGHAWLRYG